MTTPFSVFTSNGGHSAKSPGASGFGYKEHDQARICNNLFIQAMRARGHQVTDTTSNAKNKLAVLQEQVAKANRVNAGSKQLDISWHLNAGGGTGVEVYYYSDNVKDTAASISASMAKALGIKNRGAKQNKGLYFLKQTKATAILIEVCFIDCESDMQQLMKNRTAAITVVADILGGPLVSASPTSVYTGSSLVDYLKSINVDSSFSSRAHLAVSYGIVASVLHYHGTAPQNTQLLAAMRKGAKA